MVLGAWREPDARTGSRAAPRGDTPGYLRRSDAVKTAPGHAVRVLARPRAADDTARVGGGVALLVRGIRWRRWASLVLVLCAAVTVGAAAAGPVWGRAAEASLLARALQGAPVSEVAWTANGTTSAAGSFWTTELEEPRVVASEVRRDGDLPEELDPFFDEATEKLSTGRRLVIRPAVPPPAQVAPDGTEESPVDPPLARLVARAGACEQLELSAGACPAVSTEVLLSDRSAAELEVGAGDVVLLPELSDEAPPAGSREPFPIAYTVSGVYRAASVEVADRFWFDGDDLEYAPPATFGGEPVPARLDAVLVLPDLVLSLRATGIRIQVERVLRPGALTLATADRVARALGEQVEDVAGTSRTVDVSATAAVTVQSTVEGRRLVAGTATFVGFQVVVLGWVVLFGLVAVTVGARDDELALAKLRGLRGARLAAHTLTEPVALIAVAVPLGLLGSVAAVRALAGAVLLTGTPVVLTPPAWVATGATAAGAVLACALAARRSLRVPVADQLRRRSPSSGTVGPVATAVLLTLAVVGVVLVRTLGRGAEGALPALLAPVLVGLAAGVVVAHLVRVAVRVGVGRTRRWSLGPYLAVRQVAGQGALTRTTALITAVTAVSGFAAGAYVVTAAQRDAQARLDVGAERVVHVSATTTPVLLDATRTVDPAGDWAMAAVQRVDDLDTLLAVDSSRFAAAFPVTGGPLASPAGVEGLVPEGVPQPLVVRGTRASLEVVYSETGRRDLELGVQLRLGRPDGEVASVVLGVLDGGAQTLVGAIPACVDGCTVQSVLLTRVTGNGSVTGSIGLESLTVGGVEHPFLRDEWRSARADESGPDSTSTGTVYALAAPATGLELTFAVTPSATPGVVRRDVPSQLPAIVGERTPLTFVGTRRLLNGSTLEDGDLPFEVIGRTPVVPRLGQGSVVDLELVSRVEPPRSAGLDFQVWLGPTAPADAPARLADAGLEVLEVESRADRRGVLDRAEPARAQLLLLGAGAATLLAGVAGVATALAASSRRRAAESAALRAMAVPGRVVRGSAVLEDVLLLLPGVLAGAACAAVLVVVCGPVLAAVTGTSPVVASSASLSDAVLPALAVAVGTSLLLVPVVLAVTRHGDDETRLRTGT